MDIATILGIVIGSLMLIAAILQGGGNVGAFIDPPSILIVVGGSICSVMIAYPLKEVLKVLSVFKKTIFTNQKNVIAVIDQVVSLSESARRDGLLALEGRIEEIDEPFLVLGIRLAIDGMSPEIVDAIMRTEMEAVEGRHSQSRNMFDLFGKFAPAFGMMGTVIGLVIMLGNFAPETVGQGMAVCLITTLYGALAANLVCIPISEKLAYYSSYELLCMEIMARGVVAIQAGENPRVIKQKLMTFVPPKLRPEEEEQA
jgi:Flagellar motor component